MFAGNITDVGHIEMVADHGRYVQYIISSHYDPSLIKNGSIIACMGVSLTVTERGAATGNRLDEKRCWFSVEVPKEIQSHTLIKLWKRGDTINLERCLQHGDDMKGHIVKGHVDGFAKVTRITAIGDAYKVTLETSAKYMPYIVENGFITLNGLSLSTVDVNNQESKFSVILFPQKWLFTTMRHTKTGQRMHMEIDMMARYAMKIIKSGHVAKIIQPDSNTSEKSSS